MRKRIVRKGLMVVGLSFLALLFISAKDTGALNFRTDSWLQVKEEAWNENKMIFVLIGTDNCPVCAKMKTEVFTNKKVADFYNRHFVNYWLDADRIPNNVRANFWGVKAVPSYVYIDRNNKLVIKYLGYASPEQIVELGKQALRHMQ